MSVLSRLRLLAPGLAVLLGIAGIARVLGNSIPALSPLIVAIALGATLANTVGVPDWARPGLNTHSLFLETGIVLLGVRLTLGELAQTGPIVLGLATGVVVFGVLYMELVIGRLFAIRQRTTSLLAAGASVCGVSAVLAVAGSIDVDETDITYAVATILLFDAVTLVLFPVAEQSLHLSAKQFGIWTGLSLFSTGPTAAVGFAVSETAGQWATVTKLVRNTFIGVVAVGYAVRYATAETDQIALSKVWNRFPKFLLGFLVVVLVANLWTLSAGELNFVGRARSWLFLLAFAGLGFDIGFDEIREAGLKPVLLVFIHLLTISSLALLIVVTIF
ncbi:YeiH family protein [Haloarcula nitratireducens]|uniref:YeiH family protein n=1 Tax=Haloarcula nitratireducens TaxID=2487749 RepID=A0AAW4PIK6_9EURY|nr:putative sulfate exporter family transporter [Halomicroarcula nitratireducens]MBX0297478.1 YeiH family protein [Halomicroarcula nitratireducens]